MGVQPLYQPSAVEFDLSECASCKGALHSFIDMQALWYTVMNLTSPHKVEHFVSS
jgi:hypothetical protein